MNKEKIKELKNKILSDQVNAYVALGVELIIGYQALTLVPDSIFHVLVALFDATYVTINLKEAEKLREELNTLLEQENQEQNNKNDNNKLIKR